MLKGIRWDQKILFATSFLPFLVPIHSKHSLELVSPASEICTWFFLSLSRVCACTQTHTHSLTRWNMENSEWWGYFFHITYFPVEVWERWEGQRVTERAGLWCQTNPLLNSAWCDPVRDTAWTSVPLKLLRAISVLETMSVKYLRRHLITLRMKSGLCDSML